MTADDWWISDHARRRAKELGYSINDILDTAREPDVTYPSRGHGPDAYVYQRRDIAIGVKLDDRVIQTVLLRREDQWHHGTDTRANAS